MDYASENEYGKYVRDEFKNGIVYENMDGVHSFYFVKPHIHSQMLDTYEEMEIDAGCEVEYKNTKIVYIKVPYKPLEKLAIQTVPRDVVKISADKKFLEIDPGGAV